MNATQPPAGDDATALGEVSVHRRRDGTWELDVRRDGLRASADYERRLLYLAFASEDAREGLTAFTEKREPDFRGR